LAEEQAPKAPHFARDPLGGLNATSTDLQRNEKTNLSSIQVKIEHFIEGKPWRGRGQVGQSCR